jgi:hypothetical protein
MRPDSGSSAKCRGKVRTWQRQRSAARPHEGRKVSMAKRLIPNRRKERRGPEATEAKAAARRLRRRRAAHDPHGRVADRRSPPGATPQTTKAPRPRTAHPPAAHAGEQMGARVPAPAATGRRRARGSASPRPSPRRQAAYATQPQKQVTRSVFRLRRGRLARLRESPGGCCLGARAPNGQRGFWA